MQWKSYASLLLLANAIAWYAAFEAGKERPPAFYFFDVGQGDSGLLQFGPVQILIDGGPANGKALAGLERAMAPSDRIIDIAILTHPHLDHYGGLIDIMERYEVRKFMDSGSVGAGPAHRNLPAADMTLAEGDTIRWGDWTVSILAPNREEKSDKDPNKASVVMYLEGPGTSILYMGDAHGENEERLRKDYSLQADVLKVGHHGSRFSSTNAFVREVKPKIAVIGVGKNSYGHPAPAVTERLKALGAKIYATRERGMVKIVPKAGKLKIYAEK